MAVYNKKTTAKLDKLYNVTKELKKLKEQEAKLKDELLSAFKEDGLQNVNMDYGTFYIRETVTWSFSDAVAKLKDKVKSLQEKEQETGEAKPKKSESLAFRASK